MELDKFIMFNSIMPCHSKSRIQHKEGFLPAN